MFSLPQFPGLSFQDSIDQLQKEEQVLQKIRYGVAMSLDGYIAGPNGEADWIVIEPEFDFA